MAWSPSVVTAVASRSRAQSMVGRIPIYTMPFSSQAQSSSFPARTTTWLLHAKSTTVSSPETTEPNEIKTAPASSNDDETHLPQHIPCPWGLSYLPFQKEAILDYLIPSSSSDDRRGILLADEMGLGKTISVIGGINVLLRNHYGDGEIDSNGDASDGQHHQNQRRRFKALIVAPKSVLSHWENELNKWIVLPPNAIVKDKAANSNTNDNENENNPKPQIGTISSKDGMPQKDCDIYLINYEIVGKYLEEICLLFGGKGDDGDGDVNSGSSKSALDVLVCDECHYLKSVDSQRTHATLGHHKQSKSQPGVAAMANRLWLVTGSPVLNNPLELFPLLHALTTTPPSSKGTSQKRNTNNLTLEAFPEVSTLEAFRDKYCGRQVTPWGVTYKGGKNLSELRMRLIDPLVSKQSGATATTPLLLRRTKKQVLPELPDKRHQLFPIEDGGMAASEEFELIEDALKDSPSKDAGLEIHLEGLKVNDIKKLLKERGLPLGGRKSVLIDRLILADATKEAKDDDEVLSLRKQGEDGAIGKELQVSDVEHEEIIDLRSSALSVLQSAPSQNRGKILQDLLRVPKIVNASNQDRGNVSLLGALGRARHQTALRKVPYVIELLEIALLSHKVVVFAHHRDVQDAIYEAFSDRAVALNGDTPMEERTQAVQTFQTDPSIKLFVGSLRASGLGISLTAASHVIFVEMDWSPSIIQQAEDRCHRVGQKASVLVSYLFFKGTIDEHLCQLLVEKQRTVNAAIEKPPSDDSPSNWVFDFGKHAGKVIYDVAAEDPLYLKWLVDEEIYIDRRINNINSHPAMNGSECNDDLTEALIELGFLNSKGQKFSTQSGAAIVSGASDADDDDDDNDDTDDQDIENAANHFISFGKYKGKPLKEIPRSYLEWISLAGASDGKPGLTKALGIHLAKLSRSELKS